MPRSDDSVEDSIQHDSMRKTGRQLTRMVDMFWNAYPVVALAKDLRRMSDDDRHAFEASATEEQRRSLALVDLLNKLQPTLIERLSRTPSRNEVSNIGAANRDAKTRLNTGQSNGKSEDMRKVKVAIGGWRQWTPALPSSENKAERGLNHPECAFYLAPFNVDWDDEDARTQFISFGNPPMDPSLWPKFFWPEGKPSNPLRLSENILRGELMVKAARAILFSPSAAVTPTTMQVSGTRRTATRKGPIGLAKSYQLSKITPAFLAYVAVVVRFALSSEGSFSEKGSGFNYIIFYNQIREYLEAPLFEARAADLLAWWNEQLFTGYSFDNTQLPSAYRSRGALAALEAELEADKEAELEADKGSEGGDDLLERPAE